MTEEEWKKLREENEKKMEELYVKKTDYEKKKTEQENRKAEFLKKLDVLTLEISREGDTSAEAVSYTHLDVYKRQVYRCPIHAASR